MGDNQHPCLVPCCTWEGELIWTVVKSDAAGDLPNLNSAQLQKDLQSSWLHSRLNLRATVSLTVHERVTTLNSVAGYLSKTSKATTL